ncbi:hypothetical protein MRX96_004090 [Rhipicephalus microplus]
MDTLIDHSCLLEASLALLVCRNRIQGEACYSAPAGELAGTRFTEKAPQRGASLNQTASPDFSRDKPLTPEDSGCDHVAFLTCSYI